MIKSSQMRDKLIELGTQRPDEVAACRFVDSDTGRPCCIVGTALVELGVSPKLFFDDDDLNFGTSAHNLFRYWTKELGLEDDLDEVDWVAIDQVQEDQDMGTPWGAAIDPLR